jgi:predicted SAM-dependent methyltransferase
MPIKQAFRTAARIVFPDIQFVSLLKWELKLLAVHTYSKLSPMEWRKRWLLRNQRDLQINIGNGSLKHGNWINVDCRPSMQDEDLVFDLRRRWPFKSQSVSHIFAEHVFEHFSYPENIEHVMRECHRVLRAEGTLRLIVPDAERYLEAYSARDGEFLRRVRGCASLKMQAVNQVFRENGFHKYAYDYEVLKDLLDSAGFRVVRRSSFRASQCPDLNLDLDEPERRLESLYVEAVR